MRAKGLLLRALVCCAVGAIINVAVAWWIAARTESPSRGASATSHEYAGAWPGRVRGDWPSRVVVMPALDRESGEACLGQVSTSAALGYSLSTVTAMNSRASYSCRVHRYGWPFQSLVRFDTRLHVYGRFEAFADPRPQERWWGGVTTRGWADAVWEATTFPNSMPTVFPLIPIGLGLLLNTATYGALVGAFFMFVSSCRRRVRRKRGLCVRCGYLVAGVAVCPECGCRASGTAESDRSDQRSVAEDAPR